MFDLAAGTVDRPFHDKRVVPTIFSIATHIVIVGSVVGTALFWMTGGLPNVPSMMAFVAEMPAPPPPPPPPVAASRPKATEAPKPVPSTGQLSFPVEAPSDIRPERAIDFGEEEGVPGGVEGGLPGGVLGGVVGGLLTDVPLPPPPPPQTLPPLRIGGQIRTATLIRRVEPVYPDIAVQARVTGVVILEATVNERGEVVNVVVLRSIKLLDQAAIDAVKQWRYSPVLLNGTPRSFVLTVTLSFSIK
jgi:periplasmic protein TonB